MRERGWSESGRWVVVLSASLFALALGCGDDSSSDDEDAGGDGPAGERCESPGTSMAGCMCPTSSLPGVRHCGDNHVWSACSCPPGRLDAGTPCREGQPVRCFLCPGETMRRETTCLADGTFDCSCPNGNTAGSSSEPDAG